MYLRINGIPACLAEEKGLIDLEDNGLACSYFEREEIEAAVELLAELGFEGQICSGHCPNYEQ